MKREFCIFIVLFLVFHIHAQLVYHDASNFPLLGRATESAGARYERFPASLKNISRAPLWNLSRNSAGMAIRFRSNSTTIAAKWVALFNTHMNHMTDTGAKGLDLYSLLQGGCASRPGMAHTNIISRRLNRECINLGFSGNAFLDLEVAKVIAEVEASVFVLDFVPNASVAKMKERMETFYRIIRGKHPDTPIIFIEDPIFPHTFYDERVAKEVRRKNDTLKEIFNHLKKRNEKNIILISSKNMLGEDGEATVDGIHFTDLGMMRYADLVCPVIKKAIR